MITTDRPSLSGGLRIGPGPVFEIRGDWWHGRLTTLTTARATAAATVESATAQLVTAKRELTDAIGARWLSGAMADVKPADLRDHQIREDCRAEHLALEAAEASARQARAQLDQIEWELRAILALGRLVGTES